MRRALSISLILLLWLPAFAALVPGTEDARLPFCCRRQGKHHCAMYGGGFANADTSGPAFKSSSRCPDFPSALPATVSPAFVASAAPADCPALAAGRLSFVARREVPRAGRLNVPLDRGPPFPDLA